jgi:2-polyprenyl-6-methoxyphenol hydroxylase-like FAD-dependent oxidoreductase
VARILIVGGSLGGLFAANILHRAGHEIVLLEKSSETLDGRGAGIVTHAPLVRALEMAGAIVDERFGVAVTSRVALDTLGNPSARCEMPQVLTSWSRLYQMLREILPEHCHQSGVTVEHVLEDQHGVHAHCVDDRVFSAEMLVASDGLRSVIRAQFAPTAVALYAGYVGWRGVCEERVLSSFTRDSIFNCFGFGMPDGEQLIGYPVAGAHNSTAPNQRRFNFVWYRPARDSAALRALLSDADGQHYPLGIPPNKVDWRQVAAMRVAARGLLAPQFAEIIEKTAQPFLQPIFDVASEQIAFGRVVLMGDAAFVARPHVGMGVTKAGQDAMVLAQSIARLGATPDAALAYQAQRLPAGKRIVARGRQLGSYMQGGLQAGGLRDEMQVLRETAIDLEEIAVT